MAIRLYTNEKYFVDELLHRLAKMEYNDVRDQVEKRIAIMSNRQDPFLLNYDSELREINELSKSDIYKGERITLGT